MTAEDPIDPPAGAPSPRAPTVPLAPLPPRPTLAPLPVNGPTVPYTPSLRRLAPVPPIPLTSPAGQPDAAREPATIAGLSSPAAAKGGAPAGATHLPLRDASTPKGDGLQDSPAAPLPGAITTPTAATATAAAAAATGGIGGGVAAPAAVGKGGAGTAAKPTAAPMPPPHPPPPEAAVGGGAPEDGRTVEEYIPFSFVELKEKLLRDHPEVFTNDEVRKKFVELCKWISLRNTLRLEIDYGDAHEKYAPLDPDKDTLAFKAAAANGGTPVTPKHDVRAQVDAMYGELDNILNKAEFEELPREDLDKAKNDKSLMGLHVKSASDEYLEYRLHYRGTRLKKIQFRRWGIFKRQIEMNVYERLSISFRLKKPVCAEDAPEDPGALGVDTRPWYKRICGRQVSVAPSLMELRDEYLYMKLFKDVLQCDVDMLLPGAVVKFTWFDYLMIWGPILFGLGCAIWKAITGTIDFSTLVNAALSIVLIVMPVTWGVKAYMSIKEKQRLHQSHLNALFIIHNLNNNSGVISQLLDEAQEQEDNESMLAYFFLWKGQANPQPMKKLDLDRAVEKYVQGKLDETGTALRLDFEVVESLVKLERMGIIETIGGKGHEKLIQALPLDQALDKAHARHFDETRETGQPEIPRSKSRRQGSIAYHWHECVDIFRPTGQKFRYFWNAQTGESTYHEPDEPYIKLSSSLALDFQNAHGEAMADPLKHSPTTAPGQQGPPEVAPPKHSKSV